MPNSVELPKNIVAVLAPAFGQKTTYVKVAEPRDLRLGFGEVRTIFVGRERRGVSRAALEIGSFYRNWTVLVEGVKARPSSDFLASPEEVADAIHGRLGPLVDIRQPESNQVELLFEGRKAIRFDPLDKHEDTFVGFFEGGSVSLRGVEWKIDFS